MRHANVWWMLGALVLSVGCSEKEPDAGGGSTDGFSAAELTKIAALSPLPEIPPEPTNRYADDARAAALGQKLFFDERYAGPILPGGASDGTNGGLGVAGERGKVSCQSCHIDQWLQDNRSKPDNVSLAADWIIRNTPTLVNSVFYKRYGWIAGPDSIWSQSLFPAEEEHHIGGSRCGVAHLIWAKYKDEYDAIFDPLDPALDPASPGAARFPAECKPKAAMAPDGDWERMTAADRAIINRIFVNFGKACDAYIRKLVSRNAPFDRYVAGDKAAISAAAKRGLKTFIGKAACDACHSTPFFSDNKVHNTGVPQTGPHVPMVENGAFDGDGFALGMEFNSNSEWSDDRNTGRLSGVMQNEADKGKIRTKSLREVKETPPYMHGGQHKTLTEVVDFYNRGGGDSGFAGTKDPLLKPLNLTPAEVADLVAFLETLTGDPIPAALLADTSNP
jgi:cytochrome c peroxidase